MIDLKNVEPGQPVKKAWAALKNWVDRRRLVSGSSIRIAELSHGTVITAVQKRVTYRGAFFCSISGDQIRVDFGLVDEFEPVIGTEKLSEKPTLKWRDKYNDRFLSWIALRVLTNKKGEIDPDDESAVSIT
ncbi:MAG: hypothetical protein ACK5LK_01025 [Chthoniobacterales bacterium]